MGLKSQLRFHARPLLIGAAIAIGAVLAVAVWAPRALPTGVALSDIPFYRLPFGADADGAERPFWPSRLQSHDGLFSDPARVPSSAECAGCHAQEFREWAGSLHAIADRDLVYEATVDANVDIVKKRPEQRRFCEGCHAPAEMLTGRVTRHVAVAPADALTEGVSCIACHTASHADPLAGFRVCVATDALLKNDVTESVYAYCESEDAQIKAVPFLDSVILKGEPLLRRF